MGQINELKDFTRGQLDAALMKIGQDANMSTAEGICAFLQGDLVISRSTRSWSERDGVISFPVTSDGTTGPQWIDRLEKKGFRTSDYARSVLCSKDFKPTTGVTTEIAVLKGTFFADNDRTTKNIRAEADKRKLEKPNAETACLIRERFTDKEIEALGLWGIVVMHEPIKDSGGDPHLLYANRRGDGRWLNAYFDLPGVRWLRDYGFAFAVAQAHPHLSGPDLVRSHMLRVGP